MVLGADVTIEPFDPNKNYKDGGTTGTAGGGTEGGTQNSTTEKVSSVGLGSDFTLTDPFEHTNFASPNLIDNSASNDLTITTSVGVQALPPEELAVLQAELQRAGLTPSTFRPTGTLDDDTRSALLELKRTAQASGMSDLDTLRQRASMIAAADLDSGSGSGTPGKSRTVSDPVYTDPMTARAVLRDAMTTRLGRAPTSDEYHQFREALSNAEGGQDITTQTTKIGKNGVPTTRVHRSDPTSDPTPDVVADDMLQRGALGREANTVQAASYFDVIARLVGGQ